MSLTKILIESKTKSSKELIDYVWNIHSRQEDFHEGNLEQRILKFNEYVLIKSFPISKLDADEWYVDDGVLDDYRSMGTDYPPIIAYYNSGYWSIIDGTHRVNDAEEKNVKYIDTFIPTEHKKYLK